MALKPATGAVKIVDKATRPLETIAKAFMGLSKNTKKSNKDVSQFQASLNIVSQRLNFLNRSLVAGKKEVKGYISGVAKIATLGGAISAGGLMAAFNEQEQSLGALADKAQNLKMPTDELQAIRYQAELAGVSMDEMDESLSNLTLGLGKFQTTGKGALGKLAKSIPSLGKTLKGAKTNQQAYEQLLKIYAKLPTQQAKMALADAAFGTSGKKMLVLLEQGTTGLSEARKEMMDLGAFATGDDISAAEEYGDELFRMKQALMGIKFKVLAPVMRTLSEVMSKFLEKFKNADYRTELIAEVTSVISTLSAVLMDIGGIAKFVYQNFNEVLFAIGAVKIAMFGLSAVMAASPIGVIVSAIGLLVAGLGYLYSEFEGVRIVMKGVGATILSSILLPIRAVLHLISLLPSSLIPEAWGQGIANLNSKLSTLDTDLKGNINQAVNFAMPNSNPAQAMKALAPTPQNNTANITVNVQDGKVKSVESQGNFKANTFLNNGVQQ